MASGEGKLEEGPAVKRQKVAQIENEGVRLDAVKPRLQCGSTG